MSSSKKIWIKYFEFNITYIMFIRNSGLLINSMMSSFDPGFISSMASKVVDMIKDCEDEFFPKV
jgi:hypothetical protein